jgi:hypothetical protein
MGFEGSVEENSTGAAIADGPGCDGNRLDADYFSISQLPLVRLRVFRG